MTNLDSRWHQIIRGDAKRRPGESVTLAMNAWEKLAHQLIPIIGSGGFQSLYARSLHLVSARFPWLAEAHSLQDHSAFATLKANLEKRDPAEAREAHVALLITFLDILASLIGNVLTESILQSAWSDDV